MKKQRVLASEKKTGRRIIRASHTTEDMLNAFEAKLAQFGVESSTDVEAAEEVGGVVELTDSERAIVDEIADRYCSSTPLSGDWETETEHEQKAIADELNVSMDMAKNIMIDYLGFSGQHFDLEDEVITSGSDVDAIMKEQRQVEINEEDYNDRYEDVGGGFDTSNNIITLAEIKEYWNENNTSDPVLAEYSDFDRWWADTRANFLIEA